MFYSISDDPYYNSVSLLLPMTGQGGSATFTDVSLSPKTATNTGAIISTSPSKWAAGSGYFNGSSTLSYATDSSFALGSGAFTIECWLYNLSTANNYPTVIQKTSGPWAANGWSLNVDHTSAAGKYTVWCYNYHTSNPMLTSSAAVTYGDWVHVAIVRLGNNFTLYLNGNSTDGATVTSAAELTGSTSEPIIMASEYYGYIQDFRITKGVARYTGNFTPQNGPMLLRDSMRQTNLINPFHTEISRLGL